MQVILKPQQPKGCSFWRAILHLRSVNNLNKQVKSGEGTAVCHNVVSRRCVRSEAALPGPGVRWRGAPVRSAAGRRCWATDQGWPCENPVPSEPVLGPETLSAVRPWLSELGLPPPARSKAEPCRTRPVYIVFLGSSGLHGAFLARSSSLFGVFSIGWLWISGLGLLLRAGREQGSRSGHVARVCALRRWSWRPGNEAGSDRAWEAAIA